LKGKFNMKKIIDGKVFNTETATRIAYETGLVLDRDGRRYLYKTKKGDFFRYLEALHPNDNDSILQYSKEEAKQFYEHYTPCVEWGEAFDEVPEIG
jgi:hypothetical protein